jgi:hypothetical protein
MITGAWVAKTLLIKTIADAVHLKFSRIQFTPDLMPSDILGAEVIEEDRATGKRVIRFIKGPIFANIILADEINRTPPKTQAALLEAMQEYQVTVRVTYSLERLSSSCDPEPIGSVDPSASGGPPDRFVFTSSSPEDDEPAGRRRRATGSPGA